MGSSPTAPTPVGQWTRGKTTPGRLRRLDSYLALKGLDWLTVEEKPLVIDVGFGRFPWTTIELHRRLRRVAPVRTLGLDIDPYRVADAPHGAVEGLQFLHAGLECGGHRGARLVRAMNLLRAYDGGFDDALERLGAAVAPGGLLIEGTSDKWGRVLTADVYRREGRDLRLMSLVFSTNFRDGFAPKMFLPRLPSGRHQDAATMDFLDAWHRIWLDVRLVWRHPVDAFRHSARRLASVDPRVEFTPGLWRRGYLVTRL